MKIGEEGERRAACKKRKNEEKFICVTVKRGNKKRLSQLRDNLFQISKKAAQSPLKLFGKHHFSSISH